MRKLIILAVILIGLFVFGNIIEKYSRTSVLPPPSEKVKIVSEESVVIDIVEKITPSVVTVGIERRILEIDPFDPFGVFKSPTSRNQEQDIGSGFIVSKEGLIVSNKHVVSSQGKYKVITSDGKKYDVLQIYKDPANDIAILKISPPESGLKPIELGDSSKIKVGQLVVAAGTPLGEFRGTVTKGIVSGIGRGITTGSPYEGYVERVDDVIQTDAASNPGNSGGPLVNSVAQVIGVNTAIASGAENIGFAIPINIVKEALDNFNKTGGFERAYLGVAYQMIGRELSILNDVPEGAYVREVVSGSPADKAGIKAGDIIMKFDGKRISGENGLAQLISKKKIGDSVDLSVWREKKTINVKVTLESTPNQ